MLSNKIKQGDVGIAAEIVPPLSTTKNRLLDEAEVLRGAVDAVAGGSSNSKLPGIKI